MANKLIDADHFLKRVLPECIIPSELQKNVDDEPAVDAIPVGVIESWLYEIAFNNVGCKCGSGTVDEYCEEIIKRLDGLVRYNAERKDGDER